MVNRLIKEAQKRALIKAQNSGEFYISDTFIFFQIFSNEFLNEIKKEINSQVILLNNSKEINEEIYIVKYIYELALPDYKDIFSIMRRYHKKLFFNIKTDEEFTLRFITSLDSIKSVFLEEIDKSKNITT